MSPPDDNPFSGMTSDEGAQGSLSLGEDAERVASDFEIGGIEDDSEVKEEPMAAPLASEGSLDRRPREPHLDKPLH